MKRRKQSGKRRWKQVEFSRRLNWLCKRTFFNLISLNFQYQSEWNAQNIWSSWIRINFNFETLSICQMSHFLNISLILVMTRHKPIRAKEKTILIIFLHSAEHSILKTLLLTSSVSYDLVSLLCLCTKKKTCNVSRSASFLKTFPYLWKFSFSEHFLKMQSKTSLKSIN